MSDDILDNYIFFENGNKLAILSERSGYNHIYIKDLKSNNLQQLTNGNYDVMEILGFNPNKCLLYYLSAESSPLPKE